MCDPPEVNDKRSRFPTKSPEYLDTGHPSPHNPRVAVGFCRAVCSHSVGGGRSMSVLGSPRGVRGASGSRWITLTGVAVLSIVASACGSAAAQAPATQAAVSQAAASQAAASQAAVSGAVTVGSNQSDANPKAAYASLINSCASQVGVTATINTTDHGKFQDAISSYLQGTPDDVFTWFSGYRMQFF